MNMSKNKNFVVDNLILTKVSDALGAVNPTI
jgi:hypothetical protein